MSWVSTPHDPERRLHPGFVQVRADQTADRVAHQRFEDVEVVQGGEPVVQREGLRHRGSILASWPTSMRQTGRLCLLQSRRPGTLGAPDTASHRRDPSSSHGVFCCSVRNASGAGNGFIETHFYPAERSSTVRRCESEPLEGLVDEHRSLRFKGITRHLSAKCRRSPSTQSSAWPGMQVPQTAFSALIACYLNAAPSRACD